MLRRQWARGAARGLLCGGAVIHADFVSSDGSSNWLLGVQLVGTYVLIGLLFFFKTSA